MSEKDFLSQFSGSGKPESFREEERIPVTRERKPLNIKLLIILIILLLLLGVLLYFLFLAPKIEMPDFVGKNRNDVAAWVKQQQIESTGIVFNETYDFDSNEGTVLSQSVPSGKKVKKDVKINFVMSLGPDPDEKIKLPDLESMDRQQIQDWIDANKLSKTKMMTAYNENVAEGDVIDYSFSGCDEDTFTRACSLKINISKGAAPAGKVTVEDFEKKIYETAEAWAKSKKIILNKVEQYSDKVDMGYIISQSIAAGKTMEEGETLTVVVSKGSAVYMPDMTGWSDKQLKAWEGKNPSVFVYTTERYSDKYKGTVIGQNIAAGKLIDPADYVEVTVSLGNIVDLEMSYIGTDYHASGGLHDWKDKQNDLGANITVKKTYEFSDTIAADAIIRHDRSVYVGGTLNVVISKGRNILLKDMSAPDGGLDHDVRWVDIASGNNVTEDDARAICAFNDVNYEIIYMSTGKTNGSIIKAKRVDGELLKAGVYCPQSVLIQIYVEDHD